VLFTARYLLVWSAAGITAYRLFALGHSLLVADLAWHRGGRWLTAGVVLAAALYEVTPVKESCLRHCRSPTWALMAVLFVLGVMSLTWKALLAALVAFQKLGPWGPLRETRDRGRPGRPRRRHPRGTTRHSRPSGPRLGRPDVRDERDALGTSIGGTRRSTSATMAA
jgi:hypothetical protein